MEDKSFQRLDLIHEAVKTRFSQISAAQWTLLVAGTPDLQTKAILADTISDVIQKLSSEVMHRLLPAISDHLRGQESQAQKYEGAGELTTLVESEVKHRVTSAFSVAQRSTEWPSEPTLFIRSSMSSVDTLSSIFRQAVEYLRQAFLRARTPCMVLCGHCTMKKNDMTDAVRGILLKWCNKGKKTNDDVDPVAIESAQMVAMDITKSIIQEPSQGSGDTSGCMESHLSRINLNLKLIANKVKNFFKSQEKPSVDGQVKQRRFRFFKFARLQFSRMLGGLKRAFKNQDACVVALKPEHQDEKNAQSSRGDTKGAFRTSTLHVRLSQRPELKFESIQDRVAKLFDEFSQMEPEALENKIKRYMDEKLKGFSEELTSQVYEYIMSCHSEVYEVPSSRSNTPFMDSLLWGRPGKKHWDGQTLSSEVLYAMTEDAVWKFLQQLVLWMETEPQNEETYADEVSGAVSEINRLVATALNTDEDAEKVVTPKNRLLVVEDNTSPKMDSQTTFSAVSGLATPQIPATSGTDVSKSPLSKLSPVWERTPSFNAKLTQLLAYTLTAQLGQSLPSKSKKSLKTDALLPVIEHLSSRAMEEISPQHIDNIQTLANLEEVITPVVKKLLVDYASPDKLVEAAVANEPSFDDAVFKHLKVHLDAFKDQPEPNKSQSFFSSVTKLCFGSR
uniref:uncharacterized protein LOC131137817 n=1 Tax=Doryrhamphus excisus TaxID=161450 RepID=UPI0025AEC541|nr:uncharacterized protein LOC131137817 [Doryrhamphus excisus]